MFDDHQSTKRAEAHRLEAAPTPQGGDVARQLKLGCFRRRCSAMLARLVEIDVLVSATRLAPFAGEERRAPKPELQLTD